MPFADSSRIARTSALEERRREILLHEGSRVAGAVLDGLEAERAADVERVVAPLERLDALVEAGLHRRRRYVREVVPLLLQQRAAELAALSGDVVGERRR